ncbi:unnamed protein product, partial [Rotaria sordida]
KFASIRASGSGSYGQTYVTDVKNSSSVIQCLDFYYYIPGTSNNPKIQVGWRAGADTQQIIELTAHSENKWQHFTSSFTAPSSSSYQVSNNIVSYGYRLLMILINIIRCHLSLRSE